MFDFLEDILLAFQNWGRGESFWRSLAVYLGLSALIALVGLIIWSVRQ
jgi:hypothetical protein